MELVAKLDSELKKALIDRLEGWEIVDFLQIKTEDIVEIFEDEILDHLDEILEFAGLQNLGEETDIAEEY
jgi:hypothetical protein